MTSTNHLHHVVVDGSNIATEGHSLPSLAQLDEAVRAFLADRPTDKLTVVVDATFGHRIPKGEHDAYEEAILAGELVCPPAGAVGRGDAFVLQIADKADAVVLSNDSFQEFHGQYPWLFDEGRLIGGKPVREVGWVFVARTPVRGPTSRRATQAARSTRAQRPARSRASVPAAAAPPPEARNGAPPGHDGASGGRRSTRRRGGARIEPVNEPMPFIDFVGSHPVGTEVDGVVERFSSHGAYVTIGDLHGYVPLKLLGDPPPRSAKEVLTLGESSRFVVAAFDPPRRSIDVVPAPLADAARLDAATPAAEPADSSGVPATSTAEPLEAPAEKGTAKEAVATEATTEAVAKKATKTAAKKTAGKKTAAKKATAKATAAKKTATQKATAKKTTAKKTTAKKTTAKKAAAEKTTAEKTTAEKAAAKKTTAKKATKTAAKKSTTKKATAKKTTAKKATAKKATPTRTAEERDAP